MIVSNMTGRWTIQLYIFALHLSVGCFKRVFLEAVTPVVLGHDVNIFCNTSGFDDCCNSNTRRWSRIVNGNETVLIFRGVSNYPEKFTEDVQSDGFSMLLKNLNKSDIGVNYTCSYGFYSSNQILKESSNSNGTSTGASKNGIDTSFVSAIIGLIITILCCL